MFQFNYNQLPIAFGNYFDLISTKHNYNTRLASKNSYNIVKVRTNYGKFNSRYRGAVIWNSLNENIKFMSFQSFKNEIENILFQSYL